MWICLWDSVLATMLSVIPVVPFGKPNKSVTFNSCNKTVVYKSSATKFKDKKIFYDTWLYDKSFTMYLIRSINDWLYLEQSVKLIVGQVPDWII